MLGVATTATVEPLAASLRTLEKEVIALKTRVAKLEAQNKALTSRVSKHDEDHIRVIAILTSPRLWPHKDY